MRTAYRSMLRTALGALVATGLVVVATPQTATALPGNCTHTWDGGGVDDNWGTAANWNPDQVPGPASVACIGNFIVVVNGIRTIAQLHLDPGANVSIPTGAQILVSSSSPSQWAFGSTVSLAGGGLGGTGVIEVHGDLDVTADSGLASGAFNFGTAYTGPAGMLHIAPGGLMTVDDSLVYFFARYQLVISGVATLGNGTGRISADWGTATTINPGGTLELNGPGGYYQGNPLPGQSMGTLTNNGTLAKIGGGTTSIVEAAYSQGAGAQVDVDCCATLAFAGPQLVSGDVVPSMSLATGACGPVTTGVCGGSTNPAIDPSSVTLQIDADNSQTSGVQLQELAQPPDTTDSRALGHDMYADAAQLDADPLNPATITLRFSQSDVMATPLNEIQVGHIDDVTGVMSQAPNCISGTLPPGTSYCIDRSALSRTIDNTFVTVRTIQTSRWRLRRQAPGESFDQTAPGAPQGLATKLSPKDGSGVALSWNAPGNDGGAAPTAYRVYRDGKLISAVTGTSAVIMNSGPGEHTFRVSAVNVIGEGASAAAKVTLDKLSKPRKVTALRGAAGGKLTAGAKWKAPADAGGYTIIKYKIMVLKANGKKVDTKVVKASKLKYLFKLKPGRYFFKVRARNVDRWGPWSKPTDVVRPR